MQFQIEKLIYGGDGLARMPADEQGRGKSVFVPFVLPGEQVEATLTEQRPGFARGRLDRVLTPAPDRVGPGCPYFTRCGGCHYQHIAYDAQLRFKAEVLRETLRRTAKLELEQEIQVHAAEPWNYRNRTRLHLRHAPEFALGYHRLNSRELLPVETCPISSPLINQGIAALWKLGREGSVPEDVHGLQFFADQDDAKLLVEAYVLPARKEKTHPTNSGLDGAPRSDGTVASGAMSQFAGVLRGLLPQMVGVVVFAGAAVEDDLQPGTSLASLRPEAGPVFGEDSLVYHAVGQDYRVSAGAFFQTNRFLVEELARIATGTHTGRGALELYAGAGLFTALLARNFDQVIAVEASPHSFADLRRNVPHNVKCVRATTEAFLAERAVKLAPDLVVVDPPRAGLGGKTAEALCRMNTPRVTYVSCDPATLARDLRALLQSGFRVEQAHLVDMFPQTFHMETVLHLVR